MNKRIIKLVFGLVSLFILESCSPEIKRNKPNVILIMADDLGYGDLSCYGSEKINTPNLDKLAAEGIRFTDFHSNGAVCSPTRAALLTGKYQQRVGIPGVVTAKHHRHHGLALSEKTFAESFKEVGYVTGIFGKWHVGYDTKFNPIHQGFDEYVGFLAGNVDYHSHVDQEGFEDWWSGDELTKEKGYSTDLITNHAIDFITRHKDESFLLYIPHEAPHYPIQGRSSKAEREIGGKNGVDFISFGSEENKEQLYTEMVEVMDEGIGRIINTLKNLKLDKNTFVFFCSDNGGTPRLASNGPLKGFKGSVWEGGHRVTAIAWYPGIIAPKQESNEQILTMDIYPTLTDLIGTEKPQNIDGISFKNHLLEGEALPERDLFWKHGVQTAMRLGDWKLVLEKKEAAPLLFNLKMDIGEKENLANENPELLKVMLEKISLWEKDVNQVGQIY